MNREPATNSTATSTQRHTQETNKQKTEPGVGAAKRNLQLRWDAMSLRASFDSVLGGDSRRASGADDPVAGDDLEAALGGGSPATAVPQDELKAVALGKILQLSKP